MLAQLSLLLSAGDEQSLNASLSTFSGHLRRIGALRAESGSRSLVLLDEVGTGAICCSWLGFPALVCGWRRCVSLCIPSNGKC